jgi:predicted nucleic acid-binding Zn ribbon protein
MVKASEVKAQIDTHEAVCAERWKETLSRLRRLEQIMIGTTATMLVMMAGLLLR